MHFLRSKLHEKNALVKFLVTSHMLHENAHVPYKNAEANPCTGSRKIISTKEFCSSGHVSDGDDVVDFHINYEHVPTKDTKSKDQAKSLKHDELRKLKLSLPLINITKWLIFNQRIDLRKIIYRMVKMV